jgi:hypothetical protein
MLVLKMRIQALMLISLIWGYRRKYREELIFRKSLKVEIGKMIVLRLMMIRNPKKLKNFLKEPRRQKKKNKKRSQKSATTIALGGLASSGCSNLLFHNSVI